MNERLLLNTVELDAWCISKSSYACREHSMGKTSKKKIQIM